MRLLLDTDVFLWWITDDPKLPRSVRNIIADGNNELFFSAASCSEIAMKASLGYINLPAKPDVFISDQMSVNGVKSLPIQASHALHVFNLPAFNRNPFGPIIAAQAQLEGMPLITRDKLFNKYNLEVIWKIKGGRLQNG
jgi:PIN domain nuclease of toxin-antitoxin system